MAGRQPISWTDKGLRALKTESRPYEQGFIGMRGLHIRVFPNGNKVARFQYKTDGQRYRMTLGHYPTDSARTIRERYDQARSDRAMGINLVEQRKLDEQTRKAQAEAAARQQRIEEGRLDFITLADLYVNQYAKLNKKSWGEDERILKSDVLPTFGQRKVDEVKRSEFTAFLSGIAKEYPVKANRVLACIRGMLNWGVKTGYVEVNHAAGIPRPGGAEASRERTLTNAEIKRFWKLTETLTNPDHRVILRLALLTGQRSQEISQARWDEFDLKRSWWTVPGSRTKNGRDHRVPLIRMAKDELKTLARDNDWLFPQRKGTNTVRVLDKPVSKNTPPHVLKDLLDTDDKLANFTLHDARRTMATRLGDMGYLDSEIGLLLNHVRAGVTQRYNRSSHDDPKLAMMRNWSKVLDEIIHGKKAGKVIKGRFA